MFKKHSIAISNDNTIIAIERLAWSVLALKHKIANSINREEKERCHEELGDISGTIVRKLGQVCQDKETGPLPWSELCSFRKSIMDNFISFEV